MNSTIVINLIIRLVFALIWAITCEQVAENRKYNGASKCFWLGFFGGFFAFICIITLIPKEPELSLEAQKRRLERGEISIEQYKGITSKKDKDN